MSWGTRPVTQEAEVAVKSASRKDAPPGSRLETGSISSPVPSRIMMKKPRAMICTLDSFAFLLRFIDIPILLRVRSAVAPDHQMLSAYHIFSGFATVPPQKNEIFRGRPLPSASKRTPRILGGGQRGRTVEVLPLLLNLCYAPASSGGSSQSGGAAGSVSTAGTGGCACSAPAGAGGAAAVPAS